MHKQRQFVCFFIVLLLLAGIRTAYAVDLPRFDDSNCKGEDQCRDQINAEYITLAMVWKHNNEADEIYCLKHEDYASHFPGIYYQSLKDCLFVKALQRAGIN